MSRDRRFIYTSERMVKAIDETQRYANDRLKHLGVKERITKVKAADLLAETIFQARIHERINVENGERDRRKRRNKQILFFGASEDDLVWFGRKLRPL